MDATPDKFPETAALSVKTGTEVTVRDGCVLWRDQLALIPGRRSSKMKTKLLLLTTLALALLVSLTPEVEAGVSFHSRPTAKDNNRSGHARKTNSKRQVYDDLTLQMDEEQSDSAAAQMEVPSRLGLQMSEEDSRQYGEMLAQILRGLLASDSQEN